MTAGRVFEDGTAASIKCGREFLEQFTTWNGPLLVRAHQYSDGEWTLVFKQYNPADPEAVYSRLINPAD